MADATSSGYSTATVPKMTRTQRQRARCPQACGCRRRTELLRPVQRCGAGRSIGAARFVKRAVEIDDMQPCCSSVDPALSGDGRIIAKRRLPGRIAVLELTTLPWRRSMAGKMVNSVIVWRSFSGFAGRHAAIFGVKLNAEDVVAAND